MRNRAHITAMTRELVRHGVQRWHVDRSHRHPRVKFIWGDRPMFYVMPSTSSDWRASRNAVADLRRILDGRHR